MVGLVLCDALDPAGALGLVDGQLGDANPGLQVLEHDRQVPLTVHHGRLHMVVGAPQLVGQEARILEVVVGPHLAVLEVVGNQDHLQQVVLHHLAGDEVEGAGAGLGADAVVDDAGALALLSHGLVHAVVGIQDAQDVGGHRDAEVAVGDVPVVLHLQGALVQEGDELTLQPLQVAVGKAGGRLEGELALELVALVQPALQPLVLHTGGDDRNVLSHGGHDVGIGEVVDAVADIGPGLVRNAHFDVGPGRNQELLEVVAEGCLDGVGVLGMVHHCIEVNLLHTLIGGQGDQHALFEIDAGGDLNGHNLAVGLGDFEQGMHDIVLDIHIGAGAPGQADVLRVDDLAVQLHVDFADAHVAVHLEQPVLALQQGKILAALAGHQAVDQGLDLDFGPVDEHCLGVGRQSVNEVLSLGVAGGLDGGDDFLDFHRLLVQGAGVIDAVHHGLVRGTHGSGDGCGQGNQVGCDHGLVHRGHAGKAGVFHQAVEEHLLCARGILLQHGFEPLIGEQGGVMLLHLLHDALRHCGSIEGVDFLTSDGLVADCGCAFLQHSNNLADVVAFSFATEQCTHCYIAPF